MKKLVWVMGAMCAAAFGCLVLNARRIEPVEELAQRLDEAWTDHHSVV